MAQHTAEYIIKSTPPILKGRISSLARPAEWNAQPSTVLLWPHWWKRYFEAWITHDPWFRFGWATQHNSLVPKVEEQQPRTEIGPVSPCGSRSINGWTHQHSMYRVLFLCQWCLDVQERTEDGRNGQRATWLVRECPLLNHFTSPSYACVSHFCSGAPVSSLHLIFCLPWIFLQHLGCHSPLFVIIKA